MSDGGGSSDDGGSGPENGSGEDSNRVSRAEQAVMVASAAFTVALFAFAAWQAVTGVGSVPPQARVLNSQTASDGDVIYAVELRNPGDVGLVSATVEAGCTDPPVEVTFENVPADGRRVGTVVCPPGTTDPQVSVVSWVQE